MSDVLLIDTEPTAVLVGNVSTDVLVIDDPQSDGDQQVVVFDSAQTISAGLAAASTDFLLLDTQALPILATADTGADMLVITGSGPPGADGRIGVDGAPGPAGPTGLTGPTGATSAYYVHTQDAASMHWDVNYSMGYPPNVMVVDVSGDVVFGDVQFLSPGHLVIDFTSAFSGRAYLS